MIHATSLTENYEFQRVYKKGRSYPGRYVVLYYRNNNHKDLRYGITATKKIGKACKRNRARRLIFENMRLFFPTMKKGYDLVVVARPAILGTDFFSLGKELSRLLHKAGAFDAQ
ncbi:MAG: ribonuclease P protein component [Ruminococcaceae bacterium]|nr:ribonuclease P protein component [Oscillospiraceae bacterium]